MAANAPFDHVVCEVQRSVGCITLNRPEALNALSLGMIRSITQALLDWQDDDRVKAVAFRGVCKDSAAPQGRRVFGSFCAGGDIRFFHQAALAGNPQLEDFFTEEYALNHLIHHYAKPTVAFLDGIVMGGGMGLAQGAQLRIATEHTKMAMPETHIGLFPDVGGGYFLSRCPGHVGEWLGLTGHQMGAQDAIRFGLADVQMEAASLPEAWAMLCHLNVASPDALATWSATYSIANNPIDTWASGPFDAIFSLGTVTEIEQALQADGSEPALHTLQALRKASPLMLQVTLEQIRRARQMTLADELRMERDMVRHCFQLRSGAASETVEGIRALAVDKDRSPRWNPVATEGVSPEMVAAFFASPWPAHAHPLRHLAARPKSS